MKRTITIQDKTTTVELLNAETGEVFVGKATCQGDDTFNADLGIKIANHKANIKRCKSEIIDLQIMKEKALGQITEAKNLIRAINNELYSRDCEIDNRQDELLYLMN